ncbi:MAG: recombinase family protein [Patescibacteria group bacterium]|jgi:DNA invertase Pin-like site-specific DNA recombinase
MEQTLTISKSIQQIPVIKINYCLYARKSTEQDELQALSIDSQIKEMLAMAVKQDLLVQEVRKESHSAKDSGERPVFNQMIQDIKKGIFQGVIAWAPDRLSRNAGDLGILVDLMDQGRLIEIHTHSQNFTNKPNDKFMLMILGSQAKLENDCKGENVKRGLRAKCEMGWRPGSPPLGYLHEKYAEKGQRKILTDPERAPIIKQMFEKIAYEDYSGRDLSNWLNGEANFVTKKGKRVTLSMIYRLLKEPFYYGDFEYPVGSDTWYTGSHEPLITKELFNQVQTKLIVAPRRHPGTNDFDFTRLLICGNCGSGVTAEEKFKKQKNGNTHRYVYYHCTHSKDRNCKEKTIREEELLRQLLQIIDKADLDEIGIKERIGDEIIRYRKFMGQVLGQDAQINQGPLHANIRNYAKYLINEGTKEEKRILLSCLRSKLELKDKVIYLKFEGKK